MKKKLRILGRDQDSVNGSCIMLEGLFNTLGCDIIGMTTIVPLFLSYLGADLKTIGSFTTMRSILSAITPLLFGGLVAAAASKRRFSILINGVSRSSILLIPPSLLLGLNGMGALALFFGVMALFSLCQPITGLSWNYLLGDCVPPERRGALLGTLYALSGVVTFLSSAVIKAIRSSPLPEGGQYAAIFALGGALMACSVMFYLPLKERTVSIQKRERTDLRAYIVQLRRCFENPLFRRALFANIFSQLSLGVNAFFFIFAQDVLLLTADQISNLIILQTLGMMAGGVITGRVSQSFGLKRMLQLVETLGLLVPALGLFAMRGTHPYLLAGAAVFIMGFNRSGLIGYQAYILEIVPTEKTVYHIVARSLAMLPFAFSGTVIGLLITRFTNAPVFAVQIVLSLLAVFGVSRLQLNVYKKKN